MGAARDHAPRKSEPSFSYTLIPVWRNVMTEFSHAGTVIHGTHRPQDIIPAFMGKLEELAPERAGDFRASWPNLTSDPSCVERDDHLAEVAPDLISDLFDALDELAPEGWYFGAIEGDGSDFGFWRTDDDCTCGAEGLPRDQHQGDCPVYSIGTIGRWSNDA